MDVSAVASIVAQRIHAHQTWVRRPNCRTHAFLVVASIDYMDIFPRQVVQGEIKPGNILVAVVLQKSFLKF